MTAKCMVSRVSIKWTVLGLFALLGAASAGSALAAGLPEADKLIVLVRAEDCDRPALERALPRIADKLARDHRTSRVAIDWPADAARNLDLMGNPSPFAAALEVSAKQSALARIGSRVRRRLADACPADVYLVHERRLMTTPRTWPLGTPSPDTKVLVTLFRKDGLTREEFDSEWSGPHAGLALGWRRPRGGNGHYVQNLVVGTAGSVATRYDGIGEAEGNESGPASEEIRLRRIDTAAHARIFHTTGPMYVVRETIVKD